MIRLNKIIALCCVSLCMASMSCADAISSDRIFSFLGLANATEIKIDAKIDAPVYYIFDSRISASDLRQIKTISRGEVVFAMIRSNVRIDSIDTSVILIRSRNHSWMGWVLQKDLSAMDIAGLPEKNFDSISFAPDNNQIAKAMIFDTLDTIFLFDQKSGKETSFTPDVSKMKRVNEIDHFGFSSWSEDSRIVWYAAKRTESSEWLAAIRYDTKNDEFSVFELPDLSFMSTFFFDPNKVVLYYSDFPATQDTVEHEMVLKEGKEYSLFGYDLYSAVVRVVAKQKDVFLLKMTPQGKVQYRDKMTGAFLDID